MPLLLPRPRSHSLRPTEEQHHHPQNIDTDQIIPAEYLTLVPSKVRQRQSAGSPFARPPPLPDRPRAAAETRSRKPREKSPPRARPSQPTPNDAPTPDPNPQPDEYEKLGSYALVGLPDDLYPTRYVPAGRTKTPYPIVVGGENFGCGSSREHAPVALGAAGAVAVVAQSYARIFFRNCIATGEMYPVETADGVRLCDVLATGDDVTLDLERNVLTVETEGGGKGKTYALKPIGDAGPVIDAGGIFDYARKEGMIKEAA